MKLEKLIGGSNEGNEQAIEELLRRSHRRLDHALKAMRRPEAAVGVVNSSLGDLLVALSGRGIHRLR